MLGFFSNHRGAHRFHSRDFPLRALQGVELAVFAALKALGVDVGVKAPLLRRGCSHFHYWEGVKVELDGMKTSNKASLDMAPQLAASATLGMRGRDCGEKGKLRWHGNLLSARAKIGL